AGYATIAINNANLYQDIETERHTLSAIVDQTDDPVIAVSGNHRVLMLNKAAKDVFGLLEDENFTDQPIQKLIKNEEAVQFITQPNGDGLQTEADISCKDGRIFRATMTMVEGGGRSILMREQESS
ncbi:MAG: PAS domain-containing protein, partial [Anaerolineales bacterium]|nr:PAS domain-containing protein [Anaerolineales bacterium]